MADPFKYNETVIVQPKGVYVIYKIGLANLLEWRKKRNLNTLLPTE